MRRKPLAAMLVLLSAALVLGGNALLDAGWGSALRSIADRVLPNPEIAMWAPAPEPGSHSSSYADATGAGANYVYLVDAADDRGNVRELQLIFFGRESDRYAHAPALVAEMAFDLAQDSGCRKRRELESALGRGLARDRGARRLGRVLPRVRRGRGARGCAQGSGPLSAALVQFRREFQEV